jgi:DNA segregation ATPase FtsK/SpoIIIE-like protein
MSKKVRREMRSPRSKQSVVAKKTPKKVLPKTVIGEMSSLIIAAVGIFFLLALVSHINLIGDTADSLSPAKMAAGNVMGPLGYWLGSIIFNFLGWSGATLACFCFAAAYFFWRNMTDEESLLSFRYFIIGSFAGSIALASLGYSLAGMDGGGRIGAFISEPLLSRFNLGGTLLFEGIVAFFALSIALQASIFDLGQKGFGGIWRLFSTVLWGVLNPLVSFARYLGKGLYTLCGGRNKTEIEIIRTKPVPRPRVRKNVMEEDDLDDEFEEDIEDYLEDEDYEEREIKVSRRGDRVNRKELAKSVKQFIKSRQEASADEDIPYITPEMSLLSDAKSGAVQLEDDQKLLAKSRMIEEKLADFGITGKITEVHPGPVITMFEFEPAAGVKVGRIASLQDDLAMSLKANSIRIIAPIPGKGTVGIEVPNQNRDIVRLREVLESEEFIKSDSLLTIPLGKDIYGEPVVVDIAAMPHLLMAGSTGAGKSVCINTVLLSLLFRCSPAELGLILIDPKILELSVYEGIPHLKAPVVTNPKQAKAVLEWAVKEMDRRYRMMQQYGVRNIDGFNRMVRGEDEDGVKTKTKEPGVVMLQEQSIIAEGIVEPSEATDASGSIPTEVLKTLPKILIVVDEMADLMLSTGRELEDLIARLAQKARAAGIHLILATQRPSVDVITGLIKANFPARVSFRVSSRIDSRTILDGMGAEKLLGKGDMLMMMPGSHHLKRIHGAFVSDQEVSRVIAAVKKQSAPRYDAEILDYCERALEEDNKESQPGDIEYDELYDQTLQLVMEKGQASTSMIQRYFRIGYNRAARIMDTLEREGIIGAMDGIKPRKVLISQADLDNRGLRE